MFLKATKILTWIFIVMSVSLGLLGAFQVGVTAAEATPNVDAIKANNCDSSRTSLTIVNLFTPKNFFPVIPEECGGKQGEPPKALGLGAIPVILVRVYGLLASLVFYLFAFNLIFASVRFSYGAFSSGDYEKSFNMIQEGFTSIALVLTAHIIISTIFTAIFQIPLETDVTKVRSFFS
jgi:hypothetical protein